MQRFRAALDVVRRSARRPRTTMTWLAAPVVLLALGSAVGASAPDPTVGTSDEPRLLVMPLAADVVTAPGIDAGSVEVLPAVVARDPRDDHAPRGRNRVDDDLLTLVRTTRVAVTQSQFQAAFAVQGQGLPMEPVVAEAYESAGVRFSEFGDCVGRPSILAAIGHVESSHARSGSATSTIAATGKVSPPILGPRLDGSPGVARITDTDRGALDLDTAYDRAVGPMQFIPSTWARHGRDANGDGVVDPHNVFDATLSAAAYLCRAAPGDYSDESALARALFSYNRSQAYVLRVLDLVDYYDGAGLGDRLSGWLTDDSDQVPTPPLDLGPESASISPVDVDDVIEDIVAAAPEGPTTTTATTSTTQPASPSATTTTTTTTTSVPGTSVPSPRSTTTTVPTTTTTTEPPDPPGPGSTTTVPDGSSTTTTTRPGDPSSTTTTSEPPPPPTTGTAPPGTTTTDDPGQPPTTQEDETS